MRKIVKCESGICPDREVEYEPRSIDMLIDDWRGTRNYLMDQPERDVIQAQIKLLSDTDVKLGVLADVVFITKLCEYEMENRKMGDENTLIQTPPPANKEHSKDAINSTDNDTIQELTTLLGELGSTSTISALNKLNDKRYDFINALNKVNRKANYLDSLAKEATE